MTPQVAEYLAGRMTIVHRPSVFLVWPAQSGLPAGWTMPRAGSVDPKVFQELFPACTPGELKASGGTLLSH